MNKNKEFEEVLTKHGYSFYNGGGSTEVCNSQYFTKNDLLELMEEAWNLAIKEAADNADADYNTLGMPTYDMPDIECYVLKGSILKLLV